MENESNLFDLGVDTIAKTQLREAAKWGRFLAITGLIMMVVIMIWSIIMAVGLNGIQRDMSEYGYQSSAYGSGYLIGTVFGTLVVVIIYFFPCYFLLRFSNKMIVALDAGDSAVLTESFRNLKVMFRYLGVLTIIFLVLFLLGLLIGGLGS
jgi:hypothetical protein